MWEGPLPAELRSFRSLSKVSRASIRRKSRSSVAAPPSPTGKFGESSPGHNVDFGRKRSASTAASDVPEHNNDHIQHIDDVEDVPYPAYVTTALRCLDQRTPFTWFEKLSMMVILINCVTLGMYKPCDEDMELAICNTTRCITLSVIDHLVFAFFAVEMIIKIIAMGFYGPDTYMSDTWNRLDFFIVIAGCAEYIFKERMGDINLTAIRTVRVLRPLRAINRIPSMRILVNLLLDTLPMLGNVLLLCFFVFFIFGIIGVQLWAGLLRNRCLLDLPSSNDSSLELMGLVRYYMPDETSMEYICSLEKDNGMHSCNNLQPSTYNGHICNLTIDQWHAGNYTLSNSSCINWNQYYTKCGPTSHNPFQGSVSFDNIGFAWVSIYLVISLEGWSDIMYYVQDAHSFWDWIYFVLLIVIGAFFMINLCLVVIATQFADTKRRETERMLAERARYPSTSTLTTLDQQSDSDGVYRAIVKYIAHLGRRAKRKAIRYYREWKKRRANVSEIPSPHLITNSPKPAVSQEADPSQICLVPKRSTYSSPPGDSLTIPCNSPTGFHSRGSSVSYYSTLEDPGLTIPAADYLPYSPARRYSSHRRSRLVRSARTSAGSADINKNGRKIKHHRLTSSKRYDPRFALNYTESAPVCPPSVTGIRLRIHREASTSSNSLSLDSEDEQTALYLDDESSNRDEMDLELRKPYTDMDSEFDHDRVRFYTDQLHLRNKRQNSSSDLLVKCFAFLKVGIKRFVDSDHFTRGILVAILINTLSMGVEYHNQPEELTVILEYSNVFFTALFSIEMALKIIADGPFTYVSNGFNLFDGGIVILSIVELLQGGNGGLSVLRTFRLLRILKLVRFMPALRYQLVVMLRTMDNVTVFFGLLCLFIFIFSILGMNLFGCKFCKQEMNADGELVKSCDRKNFDSLFWATLTVFQFLLIQSIRQNALFKKTILWIAFSICFFNAFILLGMELFAGRFCQMPDGTPCHCKSKIPACKCPRRNFDTIINAAFTVFQILTQEDWNVVLFNGMAQTSPWSALYFIALMTFGNYVLFNLLVAILVEGFQESKAEERRLMQEEMDKTEIDPCTKAKENMFEVYKSENEKGEKSAITCTCAAGVAAATLLSSRSRDRLLSLPIMPVYVSGSELVNAPPPIIQTLPTPVGSPVMSSPSARNCRKFGSKFDENDDHSNGNSLYLPNSNAMSNSTISVKSHPLYKAGFHRDRQIKRKLTGQQSITYLDIPNPKSGSCLRRHWSSSSSTTTFYSCMNTNTESVATSSYKSLESSQQEPVSVSTDASTNNQCNGSVMMQSEVEFSPRKVSSQLSQQICSSVNPHIFYPYCRIHGYRLSLIGDGQKKEALLQSSPLFIHDEINQLNAALRQRKKSLKAQLVARFHQWFQHSWFQTRMDASLFIFMPKNKFRAQCVYLSQQKWFDFCILTFIGINCITLAMERPGIPPNSFERLFLDISGYIFTVIFALEMFIKVIAKSLVFGDGAYFKNGWDFMDGTLVLISLSNLIFDLLVKSHAPKIFSVVRVLRLLRALRPLRVINRAPGVKLVVQTLISSLQPIGNIVLICCTFFIIFGILGVQLFKGKMWHCVGPNVAKVVNKTDCLADPHNRWINHRYNFDNLDGWVSIMYQGIDAVGVDMQPIVNYFEWRMLYFISFLLLVGFFVLNMFVGVVVENFHRCKEALEKEMKEKEREKKMRKRLQKQLSRQQLLIKRSKKLPYWYHYGPVRMYLHGIVTSKYFDLAISAVIGVNVITMAMEFHMMPPELTYALKVFNYFFTAIFTLEAILKVFALSIPRYLKDRWNQLDVIIVLLSIGGIVLEEMESNILPINPTIMRVMRMLRIARVLKLLKMAKGIRSLLDTVMQALPQVGNLGLLFFLLFFIFAALGVELFGRLECSDEHPCDGLGEHAHFKNFGMAFLTLFRIATGDNWNGIMKDTLRDDCDNSENCTSNCCVSAIIAPVYFVVFVLMAQFVLVNVVVAVLMKHLEESSKKMADGSSEAGGSNATDTDEKSCTLRGDSDDERALHAVSSTTSLPTPQDLSKIELPDNPAKFWIPDQSITQSDTLKKRNDEIDFDRQLDEMDSQCIKPCKNDKRCL
ncbi:Voltage-dependent T-type calcium channel subunit alpha-1I [Trichinella pseudospiralis]|uniref:Voltage-dependent T-type calcium channel subunit alpha-1I n=1 Tax=Trichinella pseudospiralis TaxID=6337 RepID=A0A0V1G5G6_TRIPS|nr:Voltage-dependent T-type calcium channel subunit alpha-1I [Trichinella pseudospiralis]